MNGVGHEVRRLRKARGWNQAKLAVEANMAPSAVNQIENGKRNPGATSLEKLAKTLEVEVADLFPKTSAPPLPFHEIGDSGGTAERGTAERRAAEDKEALVHEVGVRALGLPVVHEFLYPVLQTHASWAEDLRERVAREGSLALPDAMARLKRDSERAEQALQTVRRGLLAEMRSPPDGPAPQPGTREAVKRALRGHPAGEEMVESAIRTHVNRIAVRLAEGYQRKRYTLLFLSERLPAQDSAVIEGKLNEILAEANA